MVSQNTVGKSLERWRSTLFLIAGALLAVTTALWGARVFMNMELEVMRGFFAPAGMTFAFLGLLGLYPALATQTPWLARAAAFFTVVGIVGTSMRAVVAASQLAGILDARPAWIDPFEPLLLVGIVLGFITFGVAVLRTDAYSRTVGLLLLIPGILFPVVLGSIIAMAEGEFPYVIHVLHNGADALALLAVGYLFRLEDVRTGRAEPAPEMTGG